MKPSVITSWSLSLVRNAGSETNTIHIRLTHITPICITLYLLTFHFGYKFFHSVSQCCRACLQLAAVGIHFCDLKITMSTSFPISLYASFSKLLVNAEQHARHTASIQKTSSQVFCSGADNHLDGNRMKETALHLYALQAHHGTYANSDF